LVACLLVVAARVEAEPKTVKALMIGNSYSRGTLPRLKGFFDADPKFQLELTAVTPGGRQLVQHARNPDTVMRIDQEKWDFVLLQDQSMTPSLAYREYQQSAVKRSFADWAQAQVNQGDDGIQSKFPGIAAKFWAGGTFLSERIAKRPGATIIYFCTWARAADESNAALKNYPGKTAADRAKTMLKFNNLAYAALQEKFAGRGKVAPVGDAWAESLRRKPDARLHAGDGSHGNSMGYYLAGAVLYQSISGTSPASNKYEGGLPAESAAFLRQVAAETKQPK
ncbi:MAG: hypothetical protein N2C14_15285, partial [Planctomycetales bacterium]